MCNFLRVEIWEPSPIDDDLHVTGMTLWNSMGGSELRKAERVSERGMERWKNTFPFISYGIPLFRAMDASSGVNCPSESSTFSNSLNHSLTPFPHRPSFFLSFFALTLLLRSGGGVGRFVCNNNFVLRLVSLVRLSLKTCH